ncbi:hypothetical protein [Mesoaciditoga sp.]
MISIFIPQIISNSLDDLYVVGGAVRDLLLGRKPVEYDLITTSPLENISLKTFAPSNNGKTVGIYYKGVKYDVTHYEDLYEDLKRRDFTINSMAIPVEKDGKLNTKNIVDPCNGKNDLKNGILRTFKAQNLFQDPVRVIRGLRFIAEENLNIDPPTLIAMRKAIKYISQSAKERVFPPLERFVNGRYFSKACKIAKEIDIETYLLFPTKNLEKADSVEPLCRWSVIFYKTPSFESFVERVFPPKRVIHQVRRMTFLASSVENNDWEWTVRVKKDELLCLIELLKSFKISHEAVEKYARSVLKISPLDLKKIGISGKDIAKVMKMLWKEILSSNLSNTYEILITEARKFKR